MEFNAHRVFALNNIIRLVEGHGFVLQQLTVISNGGEARDMQVNPEALQARAETTYNLGIFVFTKT